MHAILRVANESEGESYVTLSEMVSQANAEVQYNGGIDETEDMMDYVKVSIKGVSIA